MAEKGLGRGFQAILGDTKKEELKSELLHVPLSKVEPREGQPRTVFDENSLAELADSINKFGIIQPISVRRLESGYYQIIAGERRWRAARMAGLREVPVRVFEVDDLRTSEIALVENLQRQDLNPVEEAEGFKNLMDEYEFTQDEVAKSVGRSRSAVANSLRLLNLAPAVLKMLEKRDLSAGHARALLAISDPNIQLELAEKIVSQSLSARETERLVKRELQMQSEPVPSKGAKVEKAPSVDYIAEQEKALSDTYGRKVKIKGFENIDKKSGKIELEYYSGKDLNLLLEALAQTANKKGNGK
ncbi:ParB/RepB/Spo0J family partition protein [Clostridiaceae bacterium OttesenSCG-928-D20]|nr:ParB/RepB/Spo0J family partition protein [Clostridiaceae bacterium OttesenSCG-928-D20]